MDTERTTQILEASLERHLRWIAAADTKTGFIFAVCTAMLGFLAAAAPKYGSWTIAGVVFAISATVLLVSSLAALFVAVFPRTKGPKLSLIFFGGVADRAIDQFRRDILGNDEASYLEDVIQQCHINAQIAATKYAWVKRAAMLLYVAVIPWVPAAYILFRDRA